MPNRWITHIKEYAEKNKLSYNCSLCDPNMRREYYTKYPKKGVEIPKGDRMDRLFKDYRDELRMQKLVDEKGREFLAKKKREQEEKKKEKPPLPEYPTTLTPQQIAFFGRRR